MSVVPSVGALSPTLTGIERYTWELTSRLPQQLGANNLRYYHHGKWIGDPAVLLQIAPMSTPLRRKKYRLRFKTPR